MIAILNRWARKGLEHGDLGLLSEFARNDPWSQPDPDQVKRLKDRGLLANGTTGQPSVTLRGRIALSIRRYSRSG
jgi:hypothetical protein